MDLRRLVEMNPDFEYHIELEGTRLIETWASD